MTRTSVNFPPDYGSGTSVSQAHTDLTEQLESSVSNLDSRVAVLEAAPGGGGIFPTGILKLPELTAEETALTEAQVKANGRIFIYTSITPSSATLESTASPPPPWDLTTNNYLRLNRDGDVPGPFEYDLSTAASIPDISDVSPDALAAAIVELFGSDGFTANALAEEIQITLDEPPPSGATQLRCEAAVGGGDANDILNLPTTWQVGVETRKLVMPTLTDADAQPVMIIMKRNSKNIEFLQPTEVGKTKFHEDAADATRGVINILLWDEDDGRYSRG